MSEMPSDHSEEELRAELIRRNKPANERVNLNPQDETKCFGPLDEIIMHNCTTHLEQLDRRSWFLGLTRADGTVIQVWLCKNGKSVVGYFEDSAGIHECPEVMWKK